MGFHPPIRLNLDQLKHNKMLGGGLLLAVKKTHSFEIITTSSEETHECIQAHINIGANNHLKITNAYIYCNNSDPDPIIDLLTKTDTTNHIIVGDFNAHHPSWEQNNKTIDTLGRTLHNHIKENLILHNTGAPTRYCTGRNIHTAIDLTLSHPSTNLHLLKWSPIDDLHGSDHYPICSDWSFTRSQNYVPPIGKLKFKIDKADWPAFHKEASTTKWHLLRSDDPNTHIEKLQEAIIEIAKKTIPHSDPKKSGKVPSKATKTVSWWTPECKEAKDKALNAQKLFQQTKQKEHKDQYIRLNNEKKTTIKKAQKQSWLNHTSDLNEHTSAKKMWNTIGAMEGKNPTGNNIHPLKKTDGSKTCGHTDIANTLGEHYKNISSKDNTTPSYKQTLQELHTQQPDLKNKQKNNLEIFNKPITLIEIESVLKIKQSTAPGTDILQYGVYKHLPLEAKLEILSLFNNIWDSGNIPQMFKQAVIIPILKPQKPNDQPSSYRPISLTSHLGKTLEAIITNRLTTYLITNNKLNSIQSGFLPKRQTLDQLLRLVHEVEACKHNNKATAAVFLDLEKAFDTMSREICIRELHKKGITGNLFNYIVDYLENRTFQVRVGETLSDHFIQEMGVPQGGILSPILFNITLDAVENISDKFPHIDAGQFADDNSSWLRADCAPTLPSRAKNKQLVADHIETALVPATETLMTELEKIGFRVNVTKTQVILFNLNIETTMTIRGTL